MPAQNLDELAGLVGFRVLDRVALRQKNGIGTWEITDDMMRSWFIKRPDLKENIEKVVKKARQIMQIVRLREKQSLPPRKFPVELRDYQKKYIKDFFGMNAGMFFEPGAGKTWTMIASLMEQGAASAVIVAPGELVCRQWLDDIRKYWRRDVILALGSTLEKIEAIRSGNNIIITNYHAFLQDEICEAIANTFPQWFVLDESHKIKNVAPLSRTKFTKGKLHKSIAKNILSLSHYVPRRAILTGTPITKVRNFDVDAKGITERYAPQGISEDIFSQFYFLDHGETFGTNLYQFKIDWIEEFRLTQTIRRYAPRDRDKLEREFMSLVRQRAMVVRLKDVLPMSEPLTITKKIPVDLNFKKRMDEIKEGIIVPEAKNNQVYFLSIMRRMLQLCGGHDFGAERFHDFKIKSVLEIIDETDDKTVIFCSHLQEIDEIKKSLEKNKINCAVISGEVENKETEKKKFVEGDAQVIIIQLKTSTGLDGLQYVCNRIIYYNIDYGWANYEQSYKRVHRPGQKNVVTIYRLVCDDNYIDSVVYASIDAQDDAIVRRFLEKL